MSIEPNVLERVPILQIKSKLKELGIGMPATIVDRVEEEIIYKKATLLDNQDVIPEGRYVYRIGFDGGQSAFIGIECKNGEIIYKNKIIAEDIKSQYPFSKEGLNNLLTSNKMFKAGQLREDRIKAVIDLLLADGVETDEASPEFVDSFAENRGIRLSSDEIVEISNRYENPNHPGGEWEREWSNERKQNPPTDFYGNLLQIGDEVTSVRLWGGIYLITRIEDGNYNGEPNNYKIWIKLKDSESNLAHSTERFTYSHYVEKVEPEIKIEPLDKFGQTEFKVGDRIQIKNNTIQLGDYGNSLKALYNLEIGNTGIVRELKSVSGTIVVEFDKWPKRFINVLPIEIELEAVITIQPLTKFGQRFVKDTNGKEIHIGDEVREVGGRHRGIVRHIGPLKRRDGNMLGHDKSVWSNWGGEQTEGVGINGLTYMGGIELEVVEPQGPEIEPLEIFGRRLSRVTSQIDYNKIVEVMDPKMSHRYNESWIYGQEKEYRKGQIDFKVGDTVKVDARSGIYIPIEFIGKEGEVASIKEEFWGNKQELIEVQFEGIDSVWAGNLGKVTYWFYPNDLVSSKGITIEPLEHFGSTQQKEEIKKEYGIGDKIAFYSGGKVMNGAVEGKEGEIYEVVTVDPRSIVPRLVIKGRMIRNAYR